MNKHYKKSLVALVAAQNGLTLKDAAERIDQTLDAINELTKNPGDTLQLRGFGTLATKLRAARTGRNPQTGQPIEIPAKVVTTLKSAAK